MTNSYADIAGMDLMFIIGANPIEAHPIGGQKMMTRHKKGAALIVVDPRKTPIAQHANLWLQLKPGTDIALLNGIMKVIVDNNWLDTNFINDRTENFSSILPVLKNYPLDKVSAITGVPEKLIVKAAKKYALTDKAGIFYTLGITEHAHGVNNVISISNLALMTGHIGKPNSGVNPLRGQNNVQGACDMGMLPNMYPGYQLVADDNARRKFETAWNVNLSDKVGLKSPDMLDAAINGSLKSMYIIGENPLVSHANLGWVKNALEALEFLVVQDIFLTPTAKLAHVVLPAASYAEKNGTFTNSERRIQRVRSYLPLLGGARPDVEILMDIARAMGHLMEYDNSEAIMDEIASLVPIYAGINYERIEKKGLQWPVLDHEHPGTPFLHNGVFSRGKGKFVPVDWQYTAEQTCEKYPLILSTGRILQHYNTMTAGYSNNLSKLRPHDTLMINPVDAEKIGVVTNDVAKITSRRGTVYGIATVTDKVMPGVVWMSYHFANEPVNNVTSNNRDPISGTYEYKISAVNVEKFG